MRFEWLRALGESLQAPEKSKEKADLMHAIYDRITVAGPEIVGVRLTQAAYARGRRRRPPTASVCPHSTVKHHLANARSKVGATTTAQLVWILAPRLPAASRSDSPDDETVDLSGRAEQQRSGSVSESGLVSGRAPLG